MNASEKIQALRLLLKQNSLDGYLVPRADEFQGEFVAPCAERLRWLTGFTGSAGMAVVLREKAAVLSDGRYAIQLRQQVSPILYECADSVQPGAGGWIVQAAASGSRIGFDPRLFTPEQVEKLKKAAGPEIDFVPIEKNLTDQIWSDRPLPPTGAVELFPEEAAGQTAEQKIKLIASRIKNAGAGACLLSMPDSVSWLLNVRGNDVAFLPVVHSYAVVYAEEERAEWYVDERKLSPGIRKNLAGVRIEDISVIETALKDLAQKSVQPIAIDFARTSFAFKVLIEESNGKILSMKDPCILPRAMKSAQEQHSIRRAHVTDGVGLVRFLFWLSGIEDVSSLGEMDIEAKLLEFRRQSPQFRGESFSTIAGFGANGAIVHYRANETTNARLSEGNLLLLDSGGQYEWGTTDITRTLAIGTPTQEMCERFTLVLKGHIALARARFPEGTTGAQIDALARAPLWSSGLDYAHGTGHGVGCYLSVHEEAASISPRGTEPLKPGMLLSNEPGYYKEGAYGIRIENLVFVKDFGPAETGIPRVLGFETVTCVPIDLRLIVPEMLSAEERDWINSYHEFVFEALSSYLEQDTSEWLRRATVPI